MSKLVKSLVTDELKAKFAGISSALVVDMTGLNVQAQEKIRKTLRTKSARLEIVKNSLARRAFAGGPLEPLGKSMVGPCAVVVSKESLVDIARLLMDAAKEFNKLKLKNAIFDGDPSLMTVAELSKMKGKRELLGEVLMLVSSPGRAIAGCLRSPGGKIAGCLKAMADKAEAA
jgi:large subunit ribosomal protein L10